MVIQSSRWNTYFDKHYQGVNNQSALHIMNLVVVVGLSSGLWLRWTEAQVRNTCRCLHLSKSHLQCVWGLLRRLWFPCRNRWLRKSLSETSGWPAFWHLRRFPLSSLRRWCCIASWERRSRYVYPPFLEARVGMKWQFETLPIEIAFASPQGVFLIFKVC
jgi:hypothetical protein